MALVEAKLASAVGSAVFSQRIAPVSMSRAWTVGRCGVKTDVPGAVLKWMRRARLVDGRGADDAALRAAGHDVRRASRAARPGSASSQRTPLRTFTPSRSIT